MTFKELNSAEFWLGLVISTKVNLPFVLYKMVPCSAFEDKVVGQNLAKSGIPLPHFPS